MWWAAAQAHININTYKSRPAGTDSSAVDSHTHTQACISVHVQRYMQTHTRMLADIHVHTKPSKRPIIDVTAFANGPFPKVSLKHLPAGNLHREPVVHTVWGKHTLCKWFFFWNGAHTTRNSVLMATVSAKANGCCVCLLYACVVLHVYVFCTVLYMHLCI